jgi:hypothetical protein
MRSGDSDLDQRILDITRELCLQLDISDYKPTFVSWETLDSRSRRGAEFPHDECLIEHWCATLSGRMKGVLEPDDWRPIIASALIFSKKLRKRVWKGFVLSIATFLLPAIVLSALGYSIILPAALAIVPLAALVVVLVYTRRARLIADRKAADFVSVSTFLKTLNKIATSESPGGVRQGVYEGRPSIRERISNLQTHSRNTEQI